MTSTRDLMFSTYSTGAATAPTIATAVATTAAQCIPAGLDGCVTLGEATSNGASSSGEGRRPVLFGAEPRAKSGPSKEVDVRVPSLWWYARRSSSVFSRPPERFLATQRGDRRKPGEFAGLEARQVVAEGGVVIFNH